ncbi:Holliday junction resolvase RuvX [bacterium]|nr:Holliday junction resolvase RuvX [bacterium]
MRVLGLDPGEARIGVAVSDFLGITAQPREYLDARAPDLDDRLADLASETAAESVVVGLPIGLDGTEGPAAIAARAFAERVRVATGLEVTLQDERFTTVTAERALLEAGVRRSKRKTARDKIAAAVMLQGYLDARSMRGTLQSDGSP